MHAHMVVQLTAPLNGDSWERRPTIRSFAAL